MAVITVYRYGARVYAEDEGEAAALQELREMRRLWNAFVHLERCYRRWLYLIAAAHGEPDNKGVWRLPAVKEACGLAEARRRRRQKRLYKASRLFWGNKDAILQDYETARQRKPPNLHYRPLDLTEGRLAVRIMPPPPAASVLGDKYLNFGLGEPKGEWRPFYFRLARDGAVLTGRVKLHRPLPEGAMLRKVQLVVSKRRPSGRRYELHLTLELPSPRPALRSRAWAVVPAWQVRRGGELLVAFARSDDGLARELVLPPKVAQAWRTAVRIRGERELLVKVLRSEVEALADELPEALRSAVERAGAKPRRWRDLYERWREDGGAGTLFQRLDSWSRRDRHLGQYELGAWEGAVAQRRQCYAVWAKDLVTTGYIVLPEADYRELREGVELDAAIVAVGELVQRLRQTAAREGVACLEVPLEDLWAEGAAQTMLARTLDVMRADGGSAQHKMLGLEKEAKWIRRRKGRVGPQDMAPAMPSARA